LEAVLIFVSQTSDGKEVRFTDKKRYLWLLSVLSPSVTGVCSVLLLAGGHILWAAFPLFFYYIIIPVLDMLIGEDHNNPPEEIVEQLSNDGYYRLLLHLSIPVFFFTFFAAAIAVGTLDLPLWAFLTLTISAGIIAGSGLTVGHELGHKQDRLDRFGAKLITSLTGYSHFCIEHNHGHHVMVATPEDPTSARWNENLYSFALRELPATATIAWGLEKKRLERKGLSFWHWKNDLLQGYAITFFMAAGLILAFGWIMIPFLILHHAVGWFQLTMANYIEHYGLLREKKDNGRYVPCQPIHSWNTNHIVSNLLLFHLQRHSDHHANPMRPYQALRNFDELPRLPSGYPGSFVLAFFPPLWFKVMNPKVMEWTGGDMNKVNTGL
jgi:alkane 1-monooxygenase